LHGSPFHLKKTVSFHGDLISLFKKASNIPELKYGHRKTYPQGFETRKRKGAWQSRGS